MERRQRAEAFARLLKGTQAEPADFHLANENSLRAEIEWGASTLIVQLLSHAVPAPGRAAAPSILEDTENNRDLVEAFATLKSKILIGEIFGRIHLNSRAWNIAQSRDTTSVSTTELELLRMLAEVREPARRISRADVDRARESHSRAYPLVPDLTRLVGLGVLRLDGPDGFIVPLDGEVLGWRETTLRAAAVLWECGPRGDHSDVVWLREWIDRVAMIDWSDAPRAMTNGGRTRFLDAATAVILQEPALRCSWQHEQLRLRLEEDEAYRPAPGGELGTEPLSPLERYRRYQELYRHVRNAHGGHNEIVALINAVVRWDSGSGDVAEPGKRIVGLLRAGSERPFLSYWVPWLVLHARPAGIAWCLLHDDLAALGCGLILELEIATESAWIDGLEQIQRGMEQRVSLWDVGMRVLFSEATLERTQGLASAVAEILQAAVKASMIRRLLDSGYAAEEQRGLESILDRTLHAIRGAKCGQVVNPGAGLASFRPKLLPHIARSIFTRIESAQDPEYSGSVRFPLATMRLLARLLEVMEEARLASPADQTVPTNHEIAMAIVTHYCGQLGRDLAVDSDGTERVIHVFDEPGLATLPWGAIALALTDSPELTSFLRPVEFRERIRAIPVTAARAIARDPQADLTQAWANKLRLHLRVLLAAHAQLRQIKAPAALSDALECEILQIIHGQRQDDIEAGVLQVFRRLGVFGMDVGGLAVATAEALNRFSDSLRAQAYSCWIDTLEDIGLLMTILPLIVPAAAQTHASQRLASFAKRDFLQAEYMIPHIQKLAEDAVIASENDLAERILAFGYANVKDGLRPDWAEFEYRTRAAIAFARSDRAAFESLVIPDSQKDRERAHRIASTTTFYNALFLMNSNPDAAAEILARQDPQISDVVATNLLAARLGAAAKVTIEHEQRTAYQRALEEWHRNSAPVLLSPPSLRAAAQLNVLLALDGARHDDAFDASWAGMPNALRLQPQALGVFIANAQRRGNPSVARFAVDAALAYHRDSKGIEPTWLADLQAQIASATLMATPAPLASAVRARSSVPVLHASYVEMLQLPALHLVGAVCGSSLLLQVAESELLGEYLLWQHIEVARTLLDRMGAIRQVSNENKYNDLFVSLLHARLAFLGWQVADQTRGGQSGTGSRDTNGAGVGARDWVIRDRGGGQLAVAEAYRLHSVDSATIGEHLNKLYGYNPIGTSPTFVVVYVELSQFAAFTERYRNFVNSYSLPGSTSCVVEEHQCVLQPSPGASIKTLRSTYSTSRGPNIIFHVLMHIG